jgi:hypothetical protein
VTGIIKWCISFIASLVALAFRHRCPLPPRSTHSQKAIMVSYFRSFFGGHSSSSLQGDPKTHKRSTSAPSAAAVNPNLSYIYTAPGTTPSVASQTSRERSNSHVHAAPSPLRYPTYDTGSANLKQPSSQAPLHVSPLQQSSLQQKPARVHLYRTTSDKPGDRRSYWFQFYILRQLTLDIPAAPYPIYSHSNSYTSVHSASSSSMYPLSASGHQRPPMAPRTSSVTSVTPSLSGQRPPMPPRTSSAASVTPSLSGQRPPMPPRTSSATSVTPSEPKPALKQTKTWDGHSTYGPRKLVAFFSLACDAYANSTHVRRPCVFHESETTCDSTHAPAHSVRTDPSPAHLI